MRKLQPAGDIPEFMKKEIYDEKRFAVSKNSKNGIKKRVSRVVRVKTKRSSVSKKGKSVFEKIETTIINALAFIVLIPLVIISSIIELGLKLSRKSK